ncbi:MAG TPA: YihY/virulence factor BrkB family protein [Terriglobia bacterium]|jgi:membrane protein|nr:YihY/virulence factor BrkB family protein [Terriglobia bacterium]
MPASPHTQQGSDALRLSASTFPWRLFLLSLVERLDADNVIGLSAQISYYFALALFPFLIVLAAMVGVLPFTHSWNGVLAWITHYLPSEVQQTAFDTVASLAQSRKRFLSLGLLGAIWAVSGGLMTLMSALNAVYRVPETRSYWRRLALSVLMVFVLTLLLIATFGFLSAGRWLDGWLQLNAGTSFALEALARLARWLLTFLLSIICVAILDYVLPNFKRPWRWITPGTAIITAVWILTTLGFNFYVVHVASYHRTYGVLGGFFVLMVWIYISSLIALVGAEINSELQKVSR